MKLYVSSFKFRIVTKALCESVTYAIFEVFKIALGEYNSMDNDSNYVHFITRVHVRIAGRTYTAI